MQFAKDTSVSVEKSQAEIRATLTKYGASRFALFEEVGSAGIAFEAQGRRVRFTLPLPDRKEPRFWKTPGRGLPRNSAQAYEAWEQACRQRWRALALAIKAKLESVECGIATFEQEFYAFVILPSGRTVYEESHETVKQAYLTGTTPPLLLTSG